MRHTCLVCVFLSLTTFLLCQPSPVSPIHQGAGQSAEAVRASQADPKAQARILDSYGKLPLAFESNLLIHEMYELGIDPVFWKPVSVN